ncbi:MAG: GMC family oxidoreductase N-terminal domain-containing protein, partial [Anaerolineales bacterium]|nr:GMC family oxidoreductase N-terminal domain-containing protein [Anaerolineales bacterium]
THLGGMIYSDRRSFLFSKEGLSIIRPIMLGGATSMFCGSAAPPPVWLKERYGIDLDAETEETMAELGIAPLPLRLRGDASNRMAEAARSLGFDWQPLLKFMSPERADPFRCGARCMLGCRCRAKWSAAEYVDQAVEAGAKVVTGARVKRVIVESGRCTGVEGLHRGRSFLARARVVVLSAGGLGSPRILQASGLEAGIGMAMDTTMMVYGFTDGPGLAYNPPMTWGWKHPDLEVMFSTLVDPWLNYPVVMLQKGLRYPLTWPRWGHLLGVMVKLKDDLSGELLGDGSISKPLTISDRKRLAAAEEIGRQILTEAGVNPDGIFTTPLRGTHPSATVRIGAQLDTNLATDLPGLYVADASVFPEALGQPTVLTIIALARRLAGHLLVEESLLA